MEWLNENAKGLGFVFAMCSGFVGWLVRLEVKLSNTVSRDELTKALNDMYNLLRPMGENIANIKGKMEGSHHD